MKCKFYVRYQDDIVILSSNKDYLKDVWNKVKRFLVKEKLELNKKSNIYNMKNGIDFLGYNYKVINHKFSIYYSKKTYKRIVKKLNYLSKNDLWKYYKSLASYHGYFKKCNDGNECLKMSLIDKYSLLKEKYKNYIIIVKNGGFYTTFEDDAIIMWYLFNYKYREDLTVSFGQKAYNEVLKELDHKKMNYVICKESDQVVSNDKNDSNYDTFLKIAKVSREQELIEEQFRDKIEFIIKTDSKYKVEFEDYINEIFDKIQQESDLVNS